MMRVFKYPIPIQDEVQIQMPSTGTILSVQEQHGEVVLWALVDDEKPLTPMKFRVVGTGHPIEDADDLVYVGSVQQAGGALVWHVFLA
jgi:hypothetical protein